MSSLKAYWERLRRSIVLKKLIDHGYVFLTRAAPIVLTFLKQSGAKIRPVWAVLLQYLRQSRMGLILGVVVVAGVVIGYLNRTPPIPRAPGIPENIVLRPQTFQAVTESKATAFCQKQAYDEEVLADIAAGQLQDDAVISLIRTGKILIPQYGLPPPNAMTAEAGRWKPSKVWKSGQPVIDADEFIALSLRHDPQQYRTYVERHCEKSAVVRDYERLLAIQNSGVQVITPKAQCLADYYREQAVQDFGGRGQNATPQEVTALAQQVRPIQDFVLLSPRQRRRDAEKVVGSPGRLQRLLGPNPEISPTTYLSLMILFDPAFYWRAIEGYCRRSDIQNVYLVRLEREAMRKEQAEISGPAAIPGQPLPVDWDRLAELKRKGMILGSQEVDKLLEEQRFYVFTTDDLEAIGVTREQRSVLLARANYQDPSVQITVNVSGPELTYTLLRTRPGWDIYTDLIRRLEAHRSQKNPNTQ